MRIGEARLEHDDFVLAAGIGGQAGVAGVLAAFGVEGAQVGSAVSPPEPVPPVADVGGVADAARSPTVIGVAKEVVVVPQGDAQAAVPIVQPVLAGGVVDEDQLHRLARWAGIWS